MATTVEFQTDTLSRIESSATERGEKALLRVLRPGGEDTLVSYQALVGMAASIAGRIPDSVAAARGPVLIVASNPWCTLAAFLAAMWVNAKPLILPTPRAVGGLDSFLARLRELQDQFGGRFALAVEERLVPFPLLPAMGGTPVIELPRAMTELDGLATTESWRVLPTSLDEVAFLQMTGASTGDGKLVSITHRNLAANLAALAELGEGSEQRVASWLPLYHDMGLVGMALYALVHGFPLTIMKPTDFIARPARWLRAIGDHRCTVTTAPTFGYEYARRFVPEREIEGVDLSSLRHAVIGAEPIRLETVWGFHERFSRHGFQVESFIPAYGLAESTLISTAVPRGERPRYLLVNLGGARQGDEVEVVGEGRVGHGQPPSGPGMAVFAVGRPLGGMAVELMDEEGRAVTGERVLGEIVLRGPSVAAGYYDPAAGHPLPFSGGVLETGDLGMVDGGDLFILERKKQVIIRRGQNFLTALLEARVAEILGRPASELMVLDLDLHDPQSPIIVVVENYPPPARLDPDQEAGLRNLALPIARLLVARKRVIPRTTSGKKRYFQARQLLAEGRLPINATFDLSVQASGPTAV